MIRMKANAVRPDSDSDSDCDCDSMAAVCRGLALQARGNARPLLAVSHQDCRTPMTPMEEMVQEVSLIVQRSLQPVPWSSLRMGEMHHDPIIQMLAKEQLQADEELDLLRQSLRGIADPCRWEEVQSAIKELEFQAGERMKRAVHYGKVLRRNAEEVIIMEFFPPGLRTRVQQYAVFISECKVCPWWVVDMGRIEAIIEKFVKP